MFLQRFLFPFLSLLDKVFSTVQLFSYFTALFGWIWLDDYGKMQRTLRLHRGGGKSKILWTPLVFKVMELMLKGRFYPTETMADFTDRRML